MKPRLWIAALAVLALAAAAAGMIEAMYSLDAVLKECTHVVVGHVDAVDPKARTVVAKVDRALKGTVNYKRIRMNIALGPAHHAAYLIDRLEPSAPALIFYKDRGDQIECLVYAGDTWFQLFATPDSSQGDKIWWRFTHIEEHMGRTFVGPTEKLIQITSDVLSGRAKPPRPNPDVPRLDTKRSGARTVGPTAAPKDGQGGGFRRRTEFRHDGGTEVRGLSCTDVNGDELADIYVCRQKGNLLLVSQGAGYKEMARDFGAAEVSRSASWADYNGDDHPDLLTSNFALFTNEGGKMRNDSRLLAAPGERNPEGAGWIDYDGDGLPDVLITNGEHGIRLYRNTGKNPKAFADTSDAAGLGPKGLGVGNGDFVCFLDYDGDGFTDFFYNLGRGILARNTGKGAFVLVPRTGIQLPDESKRGVAAADFDNDGDLDLFVPAEGPCRLYRNNNDGTFTDVRAAAGDLAKADDPSFAAAWGDVNSDGCLDLFVCHTGHRSRLYLGDGKGRFTDASQATGVGDLAPAYAALFTDVDGDGDLDLAVSLQDRVVIASNDLPRAARCGCITVRVQARKGLVGAVVRVLDPKGRPLGLRELNGAESCGGQAAPVAHFGLPVGQVRLSVCLSDSRVAQQTLDVQPTHTPVTVREAQFN